MADLAGEAGHGGEDTTDRLWNFVERVRLDVFEIHTLAVDAESDPQSWHHGWTELNGIGLDNADVISRLVALRTLAS